MCEFMHCLLSDKNIFTRLQKKNWSAVVGFSTNLLQLTTPREKIFIVVREMASTNNFDNQRHFQWKPIQL